MSKNIFDRDLSWLEFNKRVLFEATEGRNPLLERGMFLAITSDNLDQFFMVRVPRVRDKDERKKIYDATKEMVKNQYDLYHKYMKELSKDLDIQIKEFKDLSKKENDFIANFFEEEIRPLLTPVEINAFHPVPYIPTGNLIVVSELENKNTGENKVSFIQLGDCLKRLIKVDEKKYHYALLEDVVIQNLHKLYPDFHIHESALFRLTRDEGLNILEDPKKNMDIIAEVEEEIQERKLGEVIRLEYSKDCSKELLNFMSKSLTAEEAEFYNIHGPLDLKFLWAIEGIDDFKDFKYKPLKSRFSKKLRGENIFESLKKRDHVLLHPFDTFRVVTEMIETAAVDPDVLAIKQTLYRVKHHDSPIINALIEAARNGKQVTVLVELKARFDEGENTQWARDLERAGCQVVFGSEDLKVHGKTLLILRREKNKIKRYVQLGTGNYYIAPYVDISLFTANDEITEDISNLFINLTSPQQTNRWKKIGVGPVTLEPKFIEFIDREIKHAKEGKSARIIAKMNGLTDKTMIDKLYEASAAGVKITLIVRGPSSILPGVKGLSENIEVYSIIGRFLEHNRAYYFENGGKEEYYLASSDWMTRNLERRIELLFPVEEEKNRDTLKEYFQNILKDNCKRWKENSDGTYSLVKKAKGEKDFNYQEYYLDNKF